MEKALWTPTLLHLLTLALQLEGEGQYNLAKLARAAADSLCRRAAYENALLTTMRDLDSEIGAIVDELACFGMNGDLLRAFQQSAASIYESRLPSIADAPHPFVCRTCGSIALGDVTEKCPTCGAWSDTFQRFSPIYWLDALDPTAALERLRQTPLEVGALLDGVSEQAMTQAPQDGDWTIRNIVTHLRDAQEVLNYRLELFSKENNPVLESKAVWRWATQDEGRPPATQEIFEDYRATRAKIIAGLENLPLAGWWRTGRHAEFGVVSIKQQVSYFALHEITHLPQIERLRKRSLP